MKFFNFSNLYRVLLLGIAYLFSFGFVSANASDLPDGYYYAGDKIDLILDSKQLIVQISSNLSDGDRSLLLIRQALNLIGLNRPVLASDFAWGCKLLRPIWTQLIMPLKLC